MRNFTSLLCLIFLMIQCNLPGKQSKGISNEYSDSCKLDNKYIRNIDFPLNKLDSISSDFIAEKESLFKPFSICDYKLIKLFDFYLKNKSDIQGYYICRQESLPGIDMIICELKLPCSNTAFLYTFSKSSKIDSLPLVTYGCSSYPEQDYKLGKLIINYLGSQEIASFINKDSIIIYRKSYYDLYNVETKTKIKDLGDYNFKIFKISNEGRFKLVDFNKGIKKGYVDKVWSTL